MQFLVCETYTLKLLEAYASSHGHKMPQQLIVQIFKLVPIYKIGTQEFLELFQPYSKQTTTTPLGSPMISVGNPTHLVIGQQSMFVNQEGNISVHMIQMAAVRSFKKCLQPATCKESRN